MNAELNETPKLSQKQLLLDGLRRLETHSPVYMLPRLITTQHLQNTLNQARDRLADSHRVQMHLLGEEPVGANGDGINVRGDTTINMPGWVLPLVAALALGAGAPLGYMLLTKLAAQPNTVQVQAPVKERDWKLGVIVTDKP